MIELSNKNIRHRAIAMYGAEGEDWCEVSVVREEVFMLWAECSLKAQNEAPGDSLLSAGVLEHAEKMSQHCDKKYKTDWRDFLHAASLSLCVIKDAVKN